MVVYVSSGLSFREREVKLGARNDNFVVIESGVKATERVALVDPTIQFDENAPAKGKAKGDIGAGGKDNGSSSPQANSRGGR